MLYPFKISQNYVQTQKRVVFAFPQAFFFKFEFISEKHFGTITAPTPMAVRLEKTFTGNAENFLYPSPSSCTQTAMQTIVTSFNKHTTHYTNLRTHDVPKTSGTILTSLADIDVAAVAGGGACNQRSSVVRSYFYQVMTSHRGVTMT